MSESAQILTLTLTPRSDEAIKPAELIQVTGHHDLTLNARRAITILWHHAHLQGVGEGRRYTVEIDELKPAGHKGYEMVVEAIEALMRTLLVVKLPNGKTRRVQFLGGNDLDSPDRPAGVLTYSFDPYLIEILQKSTIWGKIALPILMAFTSKYAISLYENVSQLVNLSFKTQTDFELNEFRSMLGVPDDRYPLFGEFNKHVLKPAVAEINALAAFNLSVLPVKQGKKVVRIKVMWWKKDQDELKAAYAEVQRSKVGRRARIAGTVETVFAPMPSEGRLRRRAKM
ncbi:replication initiation protein [Chthonobacter rhizosphaerae]|uniref:replication initiation protein n=1 Tax=Chthonobacter rhizosphaerae TaxID=2735553 RepID=UPI0015EEFA24|nr:replication initiation protein [Chthonobacter rhizosphaerae]